MLKKDPKLFANKIIIKAANEYKCLLYPLIEGSRSTGLCLSATVLKKTKNT